MQRSGLRAARLTPALYFEDRVDDRDEETERLARSRTRRDHEALALRCDSDRLLLVPVEP